MSQPERPQRPKHERKRGSWERTEGEANPGIAAQHFHILINSTWIHTYTEREEIAFLKTLSVSKDTPLKHLTHADTHKHAVRHFPNHGEKTDGLTETDLHSPPHTRGRLGGIKVCWRQQLSTNGHKNRKFLSRSSVWGSSNWISETFGSNSSGQRKYNKELTKKKGNKKQISGYNSETEKKILFKTQRQLKVAPSSRHHLFRSQPFNLGPLIPIPPFTAVNSPSSSLLLRDGVSVTACNAGLYALIIWHPPFRCAIKVSLLSSFLLCQWNNVQ